MSAQVTLPIVNELRHSGWISGNTNEESDAPYRAADTIAALYEALEGMMRHSCVADSAPEDKDGEDHVAESKARAALRQARGEA